MVKILGTFSLSTGGTHLDQRKLVVLFWKQLSKFCEDL